MLYYGDVIPKIYIYVGLIYFIIFPFPGVTSHLLCSRLCEPTVVSGASQRPEGKSSPDALLCR